MIIHEPQITIAVRASTTEASAGITIIYRISSSIGIYTLQPEYLIDISIHTEDEMIRNHQIDEL